MQKLLSAIALCAIVALAACSKDDLNNAVATASVGTQIALDRGGDPATGDIYSETYDAATERGGGCDSATVTPITFEELPDSAQPWLIAKVDTAKIQKILQITCPDGTVTYVVAGSHRKIRFDATGAVLAPPHGPGGPHGPGNGPGNGPHNPNGPGHDGPCAGTAPATITVADLPQAAQDWLTQNAASQTVSSVEKVTRPDCEVFYVVKFEQGRPVRFDANGKKIGH
ncbi:MAG: hypothetical protein ACK4Q5_11105 [Saprospiraceae bacterium]